MDTLKSFVPSLLKSLIFEQLSIIIVILPCTTFFLLIRKKVNKNFESGNGLIVQENENSICMVFV